MEYRSRISKKEDDLRRDDPTLSPTRALIMAIEWHIATTTPEIRAAYLASIDAYPCSDQEKSDTHARIQRMREMEGKG